MTILRDTGFPRTIVRSEFVPPSAYRPDEYEGVELVDGVWNETPLAGVYVTTQGATQGTNGEVCVGVLETLAEYVLLGNNVCRQIVVRGPRHEACVATHS